MRSVLKSATLAVALLFATTCKAQDAVDLASSLQQLRELMDAVALTPGQKLEQKRRVFEVQKAMNRLAENAMGANLSFLQTTGQSNRLLVRQQVSAQHGSVAAASFSAYLDVNDPTLSAARGGR